MASDRVEFVEGRKYRVRRDFTSDGDTFSCGEVVLFRFRSYSPYDGFTEIGFTRLATGRRVRWRVFDSEGIDVDRATGELFEEIPASEDVYPSSPPPKCSPDKHDWELCGNVRNHEFYVCRICGQEKYRNPETEHESFVI
ncbi:MAG TPA: hypothetical protein VFZ59_10045 [Verrucomicrobiae bacterium]|nr:hypothetical protein [Verrucomicrobiae bacterium]